MNFSKHIRFIPELFPTVYSGERAFLLTGGDEC